MNLNSNTYLIFDISNLLHRTFFANRQTDDMTTAGLAHHAALVTLNKYFREYKPHKVVMAFDKSSWRKAYTADPEVCYSGKPYKGNRRQNMTPSEKERYKNFLNHLREFEEIIRAHTSIVCLTGDNLEADDLIAGFVQKYPDANVIIVSADKDMIQLLRHEHMQLVDPATGKERTLEEWNYDAEYFMFEKCLRGDAGDNVQSAFPKIRSKKIEEAYKDPFTRINMMNETWTNAHGQEFVVKKLYEENKLLMDLAAQPECVRERINAVIDEAMSDQKKYSHFHFLRFLGRYDLKKISEQAEQFIPLLSR